MGKRFQDVYDKVPFLFHLNDFRGAEKLLRAHLETQEPAPLLHNWLGLACYRLHLWDDAVANFQAALKLDPNFVEGALNLAACLAHLGKYSSAANVYTHAEKTLTRLKSPALLPAQMIAFHQSLGQLHESVDDYGEAIEDYKKALNVSSHSPHLRLTLAKAYIKKGYYSKAEHELTLAMEQVPHSSSPHFLLGLSYYSQGNSEDARKSWRNALKINPKCRQSQVLLKLLDGD
ncbi:MAG: tetratricopeptide repeat protein [Deltaproteobacteria bacterium]|nr:tetratricopeptide repeat protein [Deltaproteobacteria bacterium]